MTSYPGIGYVPAPATVADESIQIGAADGMPIVQVGWQQLTDGVSRRKPANLVC